jgi:hypothetical protein
MVPATFDFTAGPGWEAHVVPWSAFDDADGRGALGMAFLALPPCRCHHRLMPPLTPRPPRR